MGIFLSSVGLALCLILAVVCWGISLFFFQMSFWTSSNYSWLNMDTFIGVFLLVIGIGLVALGFHYSPFELNFSVHMRY